MKKKIGITFTKTNFTHYWNWFSREDLQNDLELVELNFEKNNISDVNSCDGIILTGGVDIEPAFYNGPSDYTNRPDDFQIERDRFEASIYQYAKNLGLPLLGICRGLQLVNVLEGGKLIQDLGTEKNQRHKKDKIDRTHTIQVAENSLLHRLTGQQSGMVNSAHHQSIDPDHLGKGLRITAWATDGTIEAAEHTETTGENFFLCVQWHPERIENKSENVFSQNLKNGFLQAIRKSQMKKQIVINPATEEAITSFNEDTLTSLEEKFKQLRSGQLQWKRTPLAERIEHIKKYTSLLEKNSEDLASKLTKEAGKPLQQSRNEINGAIARTKWMTNHANKYLSDEIMHQEDGLTEMIAYEPLGVIGNISAWNYPYLVGTNVFIPALLAGNAVLYKPSEYALCTGWEIERLLKEAGIPQDVFQMAVGAASTGEKMLDLPLDGYFFTGSYKTGQYIYNKVAPKMVACQCELGGKDPLYVADDILDIEAVAAATADGAFYNNGQSCCAVERIYVHEKIADKYISAFVKAVASWKIGDPMEADVYFGPLTRKEQIAILEAQINDALQKGAKLQLGGKKINGKGYYFQPTILTNADHTMSLMREESFGPVIGIMSVKNDAEAVEKMKDTEYGLTAAVYSSDKSRAISILEQIDSGTGYWNCCDRVSPALPWSGRKHSGFGSTLSYAGLRAFTKPKSYHLRK